MVDGPRAVRSEEYDDLMALVNSVFRRDRADGPTMLDEYPHLFATDNLENLRVVCEEGRVVSHVGTTIRDAVILGCAVRVGNVGAVSTSPDFRGRGHAGACFADACANARSQGADFMLVSGDRKLYRRAGCRRVGRDHFITLTADAAAHLHADATVDPYSEQDLPAVQRTFQSEPVRHLRPWEEWRRFIRHGKSSHHYADLWVIRRGSIIVAYAAVLEKRADGTATVEEFAGDRAAVAGAAHELIRRTGASGLNFHVQSHDFAMLSLLATRSPGNGSAASRCDSGGTRLIVNFSQLVERLRPLMRERIGSAETSRLTFDETGDVFTFSYDGEPVVVTGRGGAAQFMWGTLETPEWKWSGSGSGRRAFEGVFPVPSLIYGFSYV